jgi:hypothetical protein
VVLWPTYAVFVPLRAVKVESWRTLSTLVGLVELIRLEPEAGTKSAVSDGVEAPNEVWQDTVTLWPVGATGRSEQPLITFPPFLKITAPDGLASLALAVTVAIRVSIWFVTGPGGDVVSPVSVLIVTTAVGRELAGALGPELLDAVSCTTIVWPVSAAVRR